MFSTVATYKEDTKLKVYAKYISEESNTFTSVIGIKIFLQSRFTGLSIAVSTATWQLKASKLLWEDFIFMGRTGDDDMVDVTFVRESSSSNKFYRNMTNLILIENISLCLRSVIPLKLLNCGSNSLFFLPIVCADLCCSTRV